MLEVMLSRDQLNATDEEILAFMDKHGRVTPSWVADETDNARAYVSQRLKRLKEHGHVEQPYRGLWDLVEDPRGDADENTRKEPDSSTETPGFEEGEPPSNAPEPEPEPEIDLFDKYREFLEDRSPQKTHAKDIVTDALVLLQEEGPMATGVLQEELYTDYEDHYSDARTMWNAISRYLKDLPGFEKTDYGEWGYAGDDVVRDAIGGGEQ